jgi:putative membrane protein
MIEPSQLWTAWSWKPGVLISLAVSGFLYARGIAALWRASKPRGGIRKWEAAAFAAGWLSLFVALVSPAHELGEALFSAHMAQHEILMLVAAPLLVLGRPIIPFLWGLPKSWRPVVGGWARASGFRKIWHGLTAPFVAWLLQALAICVWHIPAFFQATLRSDAIHTFQHICFLGSALLFCWALTYGRKGRIGYGAAAFYVFTTAAYCGVLGALITFAPTVWYPAYRATTAVWGLTPLQDQQLGGLIMWVPGGILYTIAGLGFLAAWLREAESRARHLDQSLQGRAAAPLTGL